MDLRELECFVAVAARLHFRRAAEDLDLSPATVSDAVSRLERGLGGKLFDRSTRKVTLTSFGDEFLPMAEAAVRKVHATFDRARARASAGATPFKVGHRGNLGIHLQVACAHIQKVCGDVHVELQEQSTSCQLESLRRGEIDAAIVWGPPNDPVMEHRQIRTSGFVAIVDSAHRFAAAGATSMAELTEERLIVWPRSYAAYLHDRFVHSLGRALNVQDVAGETHGVPNAITQVMSGRGIAISPDTELLDELRAPQNCHPCAAVPVLDSPTVELHVAWRSDDPRRRVRCLASRLAESVPDRSPGQRDVARSGAIYAAANLPALMARA